MSMDRETAIRLFNLITEGTPVGVDTEGNVVSDNTVLGVALHTLGKPSHIRRARHTDGNSRAEKQPKALTHASPFYWDTAEAAAFLREWAAALDDAQEVPKC